MARPREASKGAGTLVLVNTTSFSAASSVSLNNIFSSTYDNYRIILNVTGSTGMDLQFRLRASGTDNSTASSYTTQQVLMYSTNVTTSRASDSLTKWQDINTSRDANVSVADFFAPYLTKPTTWQIHSTYMLDNSVIQLRHGSHSQSTAYDGFTLIASTGTITGSVQIYGYRK